MYRRCLYCKDGEADIQLLSRWSLNSDVPSGLQLFNVSGEGTTFMGHQFKIVDGKYFPYFTYERASEEPGTVVYPRDSLITRMINTVAPRLNFTYTVREPLDGQWGILKEDGTWTGIVGELQNQLVDFTMDSTLTPQRAAVLDYSRVYIDESVVILSSKPRPLPEYLSLIRPFEVHFSLVFCNNSNVWRRTKKTLDHLSQSYFQQDND
ncbi:glutamate receptor ionotropic, kainate 4-like [Panulirus ornatus]|uniref:glutamate receptor ionotropic, kainate 4-like n=1 Tax=Panulirus ornatus TaxID=150431 RepID=UPI003A8B4E37